MSPLRLPRQQQGVALIMVLLVVAVIAVVATEVNSRMQFNIQQAHNRQQYQQAYWYAQGGERLARVLLETALKQDDYHHRGQAWANPLLQYPFEGGGISIQISDQQGCFNINSLATLTTPTSAETKISKQQGQFEQLLQRLEASPTQVSLLTAPLLDWLDADTTPTGFDGAEDLHYSALNPAYLPANAAIAELSELKLIEGFRPNPSDADPELSELLDQLYPYLCPLPNNDWVINLNSLTPEQTPLLSTLFENKLEASLLEDILANRPETGFDDVDQFWDQLSLDQAGAPLIDSALKQQLSVKSDFFLARIEVSYYDAHLTLFSQLTNDGNDRFYSYQRRYGGPHE